MKVTVNGDTAEVPEGWSVGDLVRARVDDRRRVAVAVTDAGRELLLNREHAVVDAMVRALAAEFTSAERHQLESAVPLLDRLAHRL